VSTRNERKDDAGVHRLVDMVVEEVSLVDRAANKHRFLVVKRDAPMKAKTDPKTDDGANPDAQPPEGAKKPKKKPAKKADTAEAIATATGILERLTSAVEMLGEATGDDADQILIELASELSEAAADIAAAAGVAEDEEEEGTAAKSASVAETVGKVRALLGEVSAMLGKAKESEAEAEPPAAEHPAPATDAHVSKQLENVASSLRSLTDAVKEQGQRLARVEKGTGLPNSRTHDERPPPREEDVGWPLDLNRPLDRESVDKATSFHDR
jgi:hypothetical protein